MSGYKIEVFIDGSADGRVSMEFDTLAELQAADRLVRAVQAAHPTPRRLVAVHSYRDAGWMEINAAAEDPNS